MHSLATTEMVCAESRRPTRRRDMVVNVVVVIVFVLVLVGIWEDMV